MTRHILSVLFSVLTLSANAGGLGTGFFVSSDGHILTNAHVIEGAASIFVRMGTGASVKAQVLTVDHSNDLALLKVDRQTKPLHVRSTDGLAKGAKVYTIGFPNPGLQGLEAKYTEGVVSSFSGLVGTPTVMQITVPIQPGNSGGPLLDEKGSVVGVVVSKLDALAVAAKQDYIPENVNFAIKSDYAIPLLLSIPSEQRSSRSVGATVSAVESSVVLIASYSAEDIANASRGSATSESPPQSRQPESITRRFTVVAPQTVDNACVVPLSISFLPALKGNDSATINIDNVPVARIRVLNGSMREFQYRIRMARTANISVDCANCSGAPFQVEVKAACAEQSEVSPIGAIRLVTQGDTFRALLNGSYPSGDFHIRGPQASIRVESTPATSRNPFVMFRSEELLSGTYCLTITTPFGSEQACS